MAAWIRTAPGVPGPAELGLAGPEAFLEPGRGDPVRARRGEDVRRVVLRPLGLVHVHVFRGGGAELLRVRFTAPRSASLAERAWNVLCLLAAQGVGTPDLLAVGAAGRGLVSGASFLVTRWPRLGVPLERWRAGADEPERAAGEDALRHALGRVAAAGVLLPRTAPDNVLVVPGARDHDCGPAAPGGRRAARLPGVVFTDVGGARVAGSAAARAGLAARLDLLAEASSG